MCFGVVRNKKTFLQNIGNERREKCWFDRYANAFGRLNFFDNVGVVQKERKSSKCERSSSSSSS